MTDLNGNGIVDPADFSLVKSKLGQVYPPADFNNNGIVDPMDLSLVKGLVGSPPGPVC